MKEESLASSIIKKMFWTIIILIVALVGTNIAWIWYINQYDFATETVEMNGNENGNNNYIGNDRETEKSFDKMLQSLEDFTYLIMQEADSQDKIEKVRKTARKISEF